MLIMCSGLYGTGLKRYFEIVSGFTFKKLRNIGSDLIINNYIKRGKVLLAFIRIIHLLYITNLLRLAL